MLELSQEFFGKYWLGNLRSLGVKRTMKNFSKDYPVNFLENADADYIAQSVAEIYSDQQNKKKWIIEPGAPIKVHYGDDGEETEEGG